MKSYHHRRTSSLLSYHSLMTIYHHHRVQHLFHRSATDIDIPAYYLLLFCRLSFLDGENRLGDLIVTSRAETGTLIEPRLDGK